MRLAGGFSWRSLAKLDMERGRLVGCSVRRTRTFRSWSVTATGSWMSPPGARGGAVRPSGAVERSVADVVADRLLSNVGRSEPRMDLDQRHSPRVHEILGQLATANRPAAAVLAQVAPGFAVGGDRDDATVLEVVRDRAEAVTEFMLDPTRAWRSDRVGDVEHFRSATRWRDLERVRAWRAGERELAAPGERGTGQERAVLPSR